MSKLILVGYDAQDRTPVAFAVATARSTGAPLIVGSVYAESVVAAQMRHGQMHEELPGDVDEPLDHLRRDLRDQGLVAECRALPGPSPPAALHQAAEEFGAGLLVVGSTNRGELGRLMPGSTAERLLHGAPCPIAVVPHGWEPDGGLRTIGVAYTDTPEGRSALRSGGALARHVGATLRVLCAVKPRRYGTEGVEYELRAAREHATHAAAAAAAGVAVETDVGVRDPAEFLIAASKRLYLLVCGSRGYGPQRAVLLGGVSRRVLADAHCPVIVLARSVEPGLEALIDADSPATA